MYKSINYQQVNKYKKYKLLLSNEKNCTKVQRAEAVNFAQTWNII